MSIESTGVQLLLASTIFSERYYRKVQTQRVTYRYVSLALKQRRCSVHSPWFSKSASTASFESEHFSSPSRDNHLLNKKWNFSWWVILFLLFLNEKDKRLSRIWRDILMKQSLIENDIHLISMTTIPRLHCLIVCQINIR